MTILDAISILLASERDPSLRESEDFKAAQNKVESNSDAREWLEAERTFFATHEGLLSAVSLRPEARERIRASLVAGTASSLGELDSGFGDVTNVVPADPAEVFKQTKPPAPLAFPRRSLMWLAAAAALAIATFLAIPHLVSQDGKNVVASSFADFGSQYLDGPIKIDSKETVQASGEHLIAQNAPIDMDVLANSLESKTMGCRVLSWEDRQVSLICMEPEPGNIIHVMIMNTDELKAFEVDALAKGIKKVNERETKTWNTNGKTYLALAHQRDQSLKIPANLFAGNF